MLQILLACVLALVLWPLKGTAAAQPMLRSQFARPEVSTFVLGNSSRIFTGLDYLQLKPNQRLSVMGSVVANRLRLTIDHAEGLRNADWFSASDPYVEIYFNGVFLGKTATLNDTNNPNWNETFYIDLPGTSSGVLFDNSSTLELNVYDDDWWTGDDPLGSVTLNAPQLWKMVDAGGGVVTAPLRPSKKMTEQEKAYVQGFVTFETSLEGQVVENENVSEQSSSSTSVDEERKLQWAGYYGCYGYYCASPGYYVDSTCQYCISCAWGTACGSQQCEGVGSCASCPWGTQSANPNSAGGYTSCDYPPPPPPPPPTWFASYWGLEQPGSGSWSNSCPSYSASNTAGATTNWEGCRFQLCDGDQASISLGCGCSGDTYLRLFNYDGIQVSANDDSCGMCSTISYTASGSCQYFTVRQGCYLSSSCSGTLTVTVTVTAPPPTPYPIAAPTMQPTSYACPPVSYGDRSNCQLCAAGTYSTAGTGCVGCPAGSWSTAGAASCVCSSGYSQSGSGTALSCSACAAGKASSANACPAGYTYSASLGRCYMYVATPRAWLDAAVSCNNDYSNGWLANIHNSAEDTYLRSFGSTGTKWIGLNDIKAEGSMVWYHQQGGDTGYRAWSWGEPNDFNREDCATIDPGNGWNDLPCERQVGYLCENDAINTCIAVPTLQPTMQPTLLPSMQPTVRPSMQPTAKPSDNPTPPPTLPSSASYFPCSLFPAGVKIVRDNLLGVVALPAVYSLTFDLWPLADGMTYRNIVHLTATGGNADGAGSRLPLVQFCASGLCPTLGLHVAHVGSGGPGPLDQTTSSTGFGFGPPSQRALSLNRPLPLNVWCTLKIAVDSHSLFMTLKAIVSDVDTPDEYHKVVFPEPTQKEWPSVKVYASDPWHDAGDAKICSLTIALPAPSPSPTDLPELPPGKQADNNNDSVSASESTTVIIVLAVIISLGGALAIFYFATRRNEPGVSPGEIYFQPVEPSAPPINDEDGDQRVNDINLAGGGNREDPNSKECCVCMDAEKSIAFLPCGHVCCCSACADRVPVCPNCRLNIVSRTRVYF